MNRKQNFLAARGRPGTAARRSNFRCRAGHQRAGALTGAIARRSREAARSGPLRPLRRRMRAACARPVC